METWLWHLATRMETWVWYYLITSSAGVNKCCISLVDGL